MRFITSLFLKWWLRRGRYPWSRLRRALFERKYLAKPLPTANSLGEIAALLAQVQWTLDGPLHLYDAISYPQTVWAKKKDDCDGFAVLAAELLQRWDPATEPLLLTVMMRPVKSSHTVCLFASDGGFRFFDNSRLVDGVYSSSQEVAARVLERGHSPICWDLAEPNGLRTREFYLSGP